MEITYLGHSSFLIKGKTASIVTDPFDSKMVGIDFPKVRADIVTLSHNHGDHNFVSGVGDVHKVINGPGEYDVAGVSIFGYRTFHDDSGGTKRGVNVIYVSEMDGIVFSHLGDLGHKLEESLVNTMGDVDVLFIPVGGEYTIGPKEAAEVVGQIEPKLIIPMHFASSKLNKEVFSKLASVDEFVKLLGLGSQKVDKLQIKREDLSEEQKIVLFN